MTDSLPAELTSFIGRAAQLAGIRQLLTDRRLVTLAGFGGCGKTRLARRIARERSDAGHGVWFVELGRVVAAEHVAAEVAAVVDAIDIGDLTEGHIVAERIGRGDGGLLVLDNCEHVADAVAELVALLLQRCAGLTVLATSREPLRVPGEVIWAVPPLTETEAQELFRDRAAAAGMDITDDPQLVAELCRRLDGIPLALELAAARVRALGVPEIAARLEDRFTLLTSGSRTASPRQRTLRGSLDWSHDLLTADERCVLRRISVCVGGFDTAMAAEVVGSDVDDVAAVVADLADRSWLMLVADRPLARYAQLETVREYGLGQLAAVDDGAATRDRHLDHVLHRVSAWASDDLRWRQRSHRALDTDYGNITAAMSWAGQRAPRRGLEIAARLAIYWVVRGRYADGRAWVDSLLAASGADVPTSLRAEAQLARCWLSEMQADHAAELAAADAGLALAREGGNVRLTTQLLTKRGFALAVHDYEAGSAALSEAIELATVSEIPAEAAAATFFAGWYALMHDGCDRAEPLLARAALDASGAMQTPPAVTVLGYCRLLQGRLTEAADLLFRGAEAFDQRGDRYWSSISRSLLAQLELARGDHPAARSHAEAALKDADRLPRTGVGASLHLTYAMTLFTQDRADEARIIAGDARSNVGEGWLGAALGALLAAIAAADPRVTTVNAPAAPPYTGLALLVTGERVRCHGDAAAGAERARDALHLLVEAGIALYVPDALDLLARCTSEDAARDRLSRAATSLRRDMTTAPLRWLAPDAAVNPTSALSEDLPPVTLTEALALATRGRGPRGRPSLGWQSLTPAELAVVRLVVEGDTNARIGERLFVSRRTVATHLEHVFTKLGVRNRAEVAAIAARKLGGGARP